MGQVCALAMLAGVAGLVARPAAIPEEGRTQTSQERPPTLRVAVDVIPVDVQVLDRQGQPIPGLGAEKFTVTINGRRHRVLSAEFVETRATGRAPGATAANSIVARTPRGGSQVIILAIDCISFTPATVRSAVDAARDFLKALPPDDLVGLVAYPVGPDIAPTVDRAIISRALDNVVGQRDSGSTSQYRLRLSDIVDIATEMPAEDGPILTAVARRECGGDAPCVKRLSVEATTAALYYEAESNVSISEVRALLQKLGAVPGRKTLVLVSGGVIASDRPGGRPDVRELGSIVGREAARANTAIYTLHVDTEFQEKTAAETARLDADFTNAGRDRQLRAQWLENFSEAAGGALYRILSGNSDYAFRRIVSETSSYYLLGVEASGANWNGVAQEIKVKVDQRHATVRSRRWVTMPRRTATSEASAAANPPPSAVPPPEASPSAAAPLPPPAPLPSEIQPLVDTFERGDDAALDRQLGEVRDLANVIRTFRTAESPWRESAPAAVFALQLAVAGLRSDNGFARDQGARLLAEYNARVRRPQGADAFECAWLWAEAAALTGLLRPSLATGFLGRALVRCPGEPRLQLAAAIVAEQQWLASLQPAADLTGIARRYEAAMTARETALEAAVRLASFLLRTGAAQQALDVLDRVPRQTDDTYVGYLAELTRGRVLRALGRSDEAVAAFKAALQEWPGAQSGRVELMTLLFTRGDRQAGAELARAVETASDDQFDPWWTFTFGDFRAYPSIVDRLRDLAIR